MNNPLSIKNLLPNYVINKWFFRTALIIIILLGFTGWVIDDFRTENYFSLECPEGSGDCINPFYVSANTSFFYEVECNAPEEYSFLCSQEFISEGSFVGEQPNFIIKHFGLFSFFIVVLTILFNHFVNNKYYFRGRKRIFCYEKKFKEAKK